MFRIGFRAVFSNRVLVVVCFCQARVVGRESELDLRHGGQRQKQQQRQQHFDTRLYSTF